MKKDSKKNKIKRYISISHYNKNKLAIIEKTIISKKIIDETFKNVLFIIFTSI